MLQAQIHDLVRAEERKDGEAGYVMPGQRPCVLLDSDLEVEVRGT
jgi:hypothetical protein